MKDERGKTPVGWVVLRCPICQFNIARPTYWQRYLCPVCRGDLVVHVKRKEVNNAQEKKPAAAG